MTKDKALKLARDWERANIAGREKLAKKHNILPVISRLRGGLKLAIANDLRTYPHRVIPGKDEAGNFIFVANVKGSPKIIKPEDLERTLSEDTTLSEARDQYVVRVDGEREDEYFPKSREGLESAYLSVRRERRPWAILHVDSQGRDVDLVDMSEDKKLAYYADNLFVESKTDLFYAKKILESALGAAAKNVKITKELIESLEDKTVNDIRKMFDV